MSQTLILDPDVPEVINPTSSQIHDQERKVSEQRQKRSGTSTRAAGRSILAAILSTLLLRIATTRFLPGGALHICDYRCPCA